VFDVKRVFITDAECSRITVIIPGVLLAVFFAAFIIAVIYIIYLKRKLQGMSTVALKSL